MACTDRDLGPAPTHGEPVAASPHKRELLALFEFEERRRAETDFAVLPPSEVVLGPEPYRIARTRTGRVGLLRGANAVVALDENGAERARVAAPVAPSGLVVAGDGDVLVVGDGSNEAAQFRLDGDRLQRIGSLPIGALGMRDIALAPDEKTAYVVEEREGRLLAISLERAGGAFRQAAMRELGRCHGPVQVEAIAGHVATNCLLDRAIEIRRDSGEVVRIRHDGPMWSFAMRAEPDGSVLIAASGVEDHALVRADGGFGYIDSFVFVYRLAANAAKATRLAAVNTSELGVIMPKWIAIRDGSVMTAGFGSSKLLTLKWRADFAGEPAVQSVEVAPGIVALEIADDGTWIAANPLLDAWIVKRAEPIVVPIASTLARRSIPSRIGELLFFTSMMAPWNSSDGKLSRFTCETCHHEGYVDGRIHYTGRDKVHAATRPLYGLFNNRPHFSRALDESMTQMVHSEFKVANRHNGRDPWFALTRAELPWLAHIGGAPDTMSPEYLREAFMSFLMDYSHRSNPAATNHAKFTDREAAGAGVFRDRCASCHAPRLIAEEAKTAVAFERWEALTLSPSGPIVWSNAAHAKTGVTPYVHENGARTPSLRRLYKKWPYFTTGAATSLADLLDRYAYSVSNTFHDAAPGNATRLTADEKAALLAFLDLL